MELGVKIKEVGNWIPFGVSTVGYGALSCLAGPFTEGRVSLWAMRSWCQSSIKRLRLNVMGLGLENIPEPPFVYCTNHQSIVDIICLGSVLPHDYKWAAKRSVMNVPFLGWHLRLSGHIPVDRKAGPEAAAKVIERFENTLRQGKPLLIFPEGTRSETGTVKQFKKGAFMAACQANVPVVPVALNGTHSLMGKGEPFLKEDGSSRDVPIKIGKPIYPNLDLALEERINDIKDRTRASIIQQHISIGGAKPDDTEQATAS